MKILCATHFFPPSVGGMQISNYLIVKGLSELGFEVRLLIFNRSEKLVSIKNVDIVHFKVNTFSIIDNFKIAKKILKDAKSFSPNFTLLLDGIMERSFGFVPFQIKNQV